MDTITLVGFIAGTLTTVPYIPQVIRYWRLKETKDISLTMLVLYAAGAFSLVCCTGSGQTLFPSSRQTAFRSF